MARKPDAGVPRTERIELRLTPDEKRTVLEALEVAPEYDALNMSEYWREVVVTVAERTTTYFQGYFTDEQFIDAVGGDLLNWNKEVRRALRELAEERKGLRESG